MNYRRIQYFLAVVEAGTVTAAAENLHIAQPALSRQVKTLERELKLRLFESQGNRLVLTPAGRSFVPVARRLMVETRGLEEAADALRTGRVSTLVAAATAASVRGFLAPFIATTGPGDPVIITREVSHFNIPESLLQGADFAVSPAAPTAGLEAVQLGSIPLSAYVSPEHEWAQAGITELPLETLCGNHAIVPSHQSVSRYILDDALNQSQLSFIQLSECDDGQTIMALAAAGRGIGITTDRPSYGAHPIRILGSREADAGWPEAGPLKLPLHVTWMPGHYAEESIRGITARIRAFLDRQGSLLPEAGQSDE